jgi:hypothetical protein
MLPDVSLLEIFTVISVWMKPGGRMEEWVTYSSTLAAVVHVTARVKCRGHRVA